MTCYGVSVATGKIANLEESTRSILAGLDTKIIDTVVTKLVTSLGFTIYGDNGFYDIQGKGFKFTLDISRGRVQLRSYGSIPTGFEDQIKALLDGLAGRVRQQQMVNQLVKAGVKVKNQQTAQNGAIVLSVEL